MEKKKMKSMKSLASVVPLTEEQICQNKVLLHLRSIRNDAFQSKTILYEVATKSLLDKIILHPDSVFRIA